MLEPLALQCPDPTATLTPADVPVSGLIASLSCFGSNELTVTGLAYCDNGIQDAAVFIGGTEWVDERDRFCWINNPDGAGADEMRLFGAAATSFGPFRRQARVVGHFEDPDSDLCHWAPGNFAPIPIDESPNEPAAFICRTHFVVSRIEFPQ